MQTKAFQVSRGDTKVAQMSFASQVPLAWQRKRAGLCTGQEAGWFILSLLCRVRRPALRGFLRRRLLRMTGAKTVA